MRVSSLQPRHRPHVAYIAANMRDWDRREIYATRVDGHELETLVDDIFHAGPVAWVAYNDLEPVAVFGCISPWRGVWNMWFFATDNLHSIGLGVTKLVIRHIVPMLWEDGAHRLQCNSMEGHVDAQRWLETLGARREATLAGYGRDGEDFHTYVWRRPEGVGG